MTLEIIIKAPYGAADPTMYYSQGHQYNLLLSQTLKGIQQTFNGLSVFLE